ncbi:hypothetical protein Q8G31_27025 [Priestia megaterium]|uniref:hypothetical protein n=1 Tax=Priestia megaterium TaxID=1404 RepID=UPI00272F812F|nr:hypothetical protein [Priestia megaterium]MDP1383372.1 hypothetical protein [Priestia megaterium]MDP1427520.1 hypothetical protein [Priestia megaterium]
MINHRFLKNVRLSLISIEIDSFRDYAKYIESSFRKELDFFEDEAKRVPEGLEDEFWDSYMDEARQYSKEFPRIMRNSLFVSIYTFLESKIADLCVSDEKTLLTLSDIRGQGIEQASTYLKKVLFIDFPYDTEEWKYIKKAQLLRNCIVHTNGQLSKVRKPESVEKAIEELDFVNKDDNGYISLESEFCLDFIETVYLFLQELYQK